MSRDRIAFALRIVSTMLLLAVALPGEILACPVCYGETDSGMADGINNGILALLAVIGGVQVAFVALFVNFRKRAKKLRVGGIGAEDESQKSSEGTLS